MDILSQLVTGGLSTSVPLPSLSTVAVVVIPLLLASILNHLIQRFVRVPKNLESPRTKTYMSVTQSIITTIIYLIAVYYILLQLHINVTPLFASAGVIGIIVGLGIRPFIEDFFTGILILTQDTIRVGDYVEIAGAQGITEALGLRTVRIKDQHGAIHVFPNREIKKIVNYSRRQARVVIDIPIKTNQPLDKAITALTHALTKLRKDKILGPLILEGSVVQGVEHIHGGSLVIRILILTRAAFRWDTARKYRYLALKELTKANIALA
jgi:moderate conductance mechanosensitive channel